MFGYIPSKPDIRDYMMKAVIPQDITLPKKFSWKSNIPFVRDQKSYGACVGFASTAMKNIHEYTEAHLPEQGLSPWYIYSACKANDGIPNEEGTYPRVALDILRKVGATPETLCPYDKVQNAFDYAKLTEEMNIQASKYKIKSYANVPRDVDSIKRALINSPLLCGVFVTSAFVNSENGFCWQPEGSILGGHAIAIVGFDDELTYTYKNGVTQKGFIIFQNSWGTQWGDNGFGYIPYEDLDDTNDWFGYYIMELWGVFDEITESTRIEPIQEQEPVIPPTPEPVKPKYYKVQCGAFSIKDNVIKLVEKLKSLGFDTYVPPISADGLYRCQVGAFSIRENAEILKQKLVDAGFTDAFIVYK